MWPPEDKEPPEGIPDEKEEQYRVSVDWFFEAEEYNEWMCEEDYEVDEKGQKTNFGLDGIRTHIHHKIRLAVLYAVHCATMTSYFQVQIFSL